MRSLALAVLLAGLASDAGAEALRVGGTGAMTEAMRQLGARFSADTGVSFEIVPNLGSNGGLRAIAAGALDLSVAGRPLTADETARGLHEVLALSTPYVIVTSHRRPTGVKAADVAGLFSDAGATWADGQGVRVILRPKTDSDTGTMGELFPGAAAAITVARARADVPTAATDGDNADTAERTPGSLTGATYVQILLEKRNLRFVPIDGVEPSIESFERGDYKQRKLLRFVLPATGSPAAERFIAFLRSPDGIAALRGMGVLPAAT